MGTADIANTRSEEGRSEAMRTALRVQSDGLLAGRKAGGLLWLRLFATGRVAHLEATSPKLRARERGPVHKLKT
jgi:hypothetical protein